MIWVTALVVGLAPWPAGWVERVYSRGLYPAMQPTVTALSSRVSVALFDVGVGVLLCVLLVVIIRGRRRGGWRLAGRAALLWLVTTTAVVYLLFMASWGFNYRRVPLEAKLDFDRGRISRDAAVRLATEAVTQLNAGHAAAHAARVGVETLARELEATARLLGGGGVTVAEPKASLFGLYFRQAAIDGMTVPVFLEIILNPDLLAVEWPSVLAHEWAHLAGYADESEASFVAWVAGVRSQDPVARYSAWLDAYRAAAGVLPRPVRATLPPLAAGPRADFAAIAARYERSSPRVRNAARGVYDSYLRANRIDEGIANYGVVLQLMLGTAFEKEWAPKVR